MIINTEILTTAEVVTLALNDLKGFDQSKIKSFIILSQREYLKPFLSVDFYNSLLNEIDTATVSVDNQILLDNFLKPMLANFIVYDAFPEIQINITSKGLMKNESETSESASSKDASVLRSNKFHIAERWRKDATDFINENEGKYPLFQQENKQQTNKNGIIFY